MIIFRRGRSKNLRFEPRLHQEREQESRNCPDWRVQSAYHTLGPSSSSDAIGTLEEVPLAGHVDQTLACLQRRQLVLESSSSVTILSLSRQMPVAWIQGLHSSCGGAKNPCQAREFPFQMPSSHDPSQLTRRIFAVAAFACPLGNCFTPRRMMASESLGKGSSNLESTPSDHLEMPHPKPLTFRLSTVLPNLATSGLGLQKINHAFCWSFLCGIIFPKSEPRPQPVISFCPSNLSRLDCSKLVLQVSLLLEGSHSIGFINIELV